MVFGAVEVNSYFASVLVDFIRHDLVRRKVSFTFETVMSAHAKVEFFCQAREQGFRTHLYYVATEDPEINVSRVAHRVSMGKHDVPRDKIIERYHRSLDYLADAVMCSDRAYGFDNSTAERVWVAEITDGAYLEMKTDSMPYWFKIALLDKLAADEPWARLARQRTREQATCKLPSARSRKPPRPACWRCSSTDWATAIWATGSTATTATSTRPCWRPG